LGFSLLELLASMAILLVVSGAAFSALVAYQKSYGSTLLKSDMNASMRDALALLGQEIGQAGLVSLLPAQLGASITPSSSAQSVAVSSTSGIFVGEKLLIDAGSSQELVAITAVGTSPSSITGIFAKAHSSGAPVSAAGVFSQGVLSSSTGTQLQLLGDINADGTLAYVRYDCDTTAGTLSRSITPISAYASNPPAVLVQNLVANPDGTPCFSYTRTTVGGYTFVTSVALTLSIQTATRDPQTGAYVTMTKSFLNLTPRNLLAGVALAQAGWTERLQPTPPRVPLP